MQVLILKTNQIQEVKDSYAINYLIPKGLAVLATKQLQQDLANKQAQKQLESQQRQQKQKVAVTQLEGKTFVMKAKANSEGHLYASIGNNQIKKLLKIKELIDIQTDEPIKKLGSYRVAIKAGNLKGYITLQVTS